MIKLEIHICFVNVLFYLYIQILLIYLKVLAESLGDLQLERKSIMKEFKTNYKIINPKAITLGQLYGSFDGVSHEWHDGKLL